MTPPDRTTSTARRSGQAAGLIRVSGSGRCRLFRRRCQLRRRFGEAAFLARAHALGAFALGGLHREDRPVALRAGLRQGQVPYRVLAVRVTGAGVEHLAVARLALEEGGLLALGTLDAGVRRLLQGLDVLAVRVAGAADELAVAAAADDEVGVALGALPAFDLLRLGGLLGGLVQVAGVVAVRVAGAADEAAAAAEPDRQRLAALRAGLVKRLGGDVLARDVLFLVVHQLLERVPELVHHRHPFLLAAG